MVYEGLGWMVGVIIDPFFQEQSLISLMQYVNSELQLILN